MKATMNATTHQAQSRQHGAATTDAAAPKHGRPWPPKRPKARDGNRGPSEKLTSGLQTADNPTTRVKPDSRPAPVDDSKLWAEVSPAATWRPCKHHGTVARPRVREWRFANGSRHLRLYCPSCQRSLGLAKRTKAFEKAPLETQEAVYRAYLADAKARGWLPGNAYYRFKSRFGRDPDPAWRPGTGEERP